MQRQSIGSPGGKVQVNGNGGGGEREDRRKSAAGVAAAAGEENIEVEKMIRSSSRTERSIHLIPVLTFLSLLLLYLISHDPTPKELEKLGGDAHLLFHNGELATETARNIDVGIGGGVTAIRSHRGLKETRKLRHRKLGKLF